MRTVGQTCVQSACTPFGGSIEAAELKEAASHVLLLEQEARRALEENDRYYYIHFFKIILISLCMLLKPNVRISFPPSESA